MIKLSDTEDIVDIYEKILVEANNGASSDEILPLVKVLSKHQDKENKSPTFYKTHYWRIKAKLENKSNLDQLKDMYDWINEYIDTPEESRVKLNKTLPVKNNPQYQWSDPNASDQPEDENPDGDYTYNSEDEIPSDVVEETPVAEEETPVAEEETNIDDILNALSNDEKLTPEEIEEIISGVSNTPTPEEEISTPTVEDDPAADPGLTDEVSNVVEQAETPPPPAPKSKKPRKKKEEAPFIPPTTPTEDVEEGIVGNETPTEQIVNNPEDLTPEEIQQLLESIGKVDDKVIPEEESVETPAPVEEIQPVVPFPDIHPEEPSLPDNEEDDYIKKVDMGIGKQEPSIEETPPTSTGNTVDINAIPPQDYNKLLLVKLRDGSVGLYVGDKLYSLVDNGLMNDNAIQQLNQDAGDQSVEAVTERDNLEKGKEVYYKKDNHFYKGTISDIKTRGITIKLESGGNAFVTTNRIDEEIAPTVMPNLDLLSINKDKLSKVRQSLNVMPNMNLPNVNKAMQALSNKDLSGYKHGNSYIIYSPELADVFKSSPELQKFVINDTFVSMSSRLIEDNPIPNLYNDKLSIYELPTQLRDAIDKYKFDYQNYGINKEDLIVLQNDNLERHGSDSDYKKRYEQALERVKRGLYVWSQQYKSIQVNNQANNKFIREALLNGWRYLDEGLSPADLETTSKNYKKAIGAAREYLRNHALHSSDVDKVEMIKIATIIYNIPCFDIEESTFKLSNTIDESNARKFKT